jgi:acyl-CoA thioesterase YciA
MPLNRPDSLGEDYELTYRVVAAPADTNYRGDIFGGWLMAQVDIAGSILAVREASGRVATVAVKEFRFLGPVRVGDLVSCYSRVEAVGRTSVTIHVEVHAVQQPDDFSLRRVAEATLVYVALDEQGQPRMVRARA